MENDPFAYLYYKSNCLVIVHVVIVTMCLVYNLLLLKVYKAKEYKGCLAFRDVTKLDSIWARTQFGAHTFQLMPTPILYGR